jgi:hypothetical protein
MGKGSDLTGRRFGRLTALRPAGRRHGRVMWLCRCACGRTHEVEARNLRDGNTRSCGRLRRETTPLNAGRPPQPERDAAMRRERAAGATLAALAEKYGLTPQGVHRIVGTRKAASGAGRPDALPRCKRLVRALSPRDRGRLGRWMRNGMKE